MTDTGQMIDTVSIRKLRLGDGLILQRPDGTWYDRTVYYLSESTGPDDIGVPPSTIFAHDEKDTVRDRFLHSSDYRLAPLPLHPHEVDFPQPQLTLKTPLLLLGRDDPKFTTHRAFRLFKSIAQEETDDLGLDHRALRYAAQNFYPGAAVNLSCDRGDVSARIKAVGIGIGGAIGILLHQAPISIGIRNERYQIMAADLWIDATKAEVSIIDKCEPERIAMNFHKLRSMTVPAHA